MGTQFSSRLSSAATSRLITGLRAARSELGGTTGSEKNSRKKALEKAYVVNILSVASGFDFLTDLEKSKCFETVLAWLRRIHSDARINGFKNTMKCFKDPQNPVPSLGKMLKEITDNFAADPFRVSISKTAKSIIGQAASIDLKFEKEETEARSLGRKFGTLTGEHIVEHFVRGFLARFIESILDRADPDHCDKVITDAMKLSKKTVYRLALSTIQKTKSNGKLNDYRAIKSILIDELKKEMSTN